MRMHPVFARGAFALVIGALSFAPGLVQAASTFHSGDIFFGSPTVTLGKTNSFDISWVDAQAHQYYLADRSNKNIEIVDTQTNRWVAQVTGFIGAVVGANGAVNNDASGPNGVVVAQSGRELWAGDGHSLVQVVNLQSNTIEATVNTGGVNRADEIAVGGGLILIANDAESDAKGNPCPFLSFISLTTHQVLAQVVYDANASSCTRDHTNTDAAGHSFPPPPSNVKVTHQPYAATDGLEQPVWDPGRSKFFQAVPLTSDTLGANGEIDELDPGSMAVVNRFAVGSPGDQCHPQGLVVGLKNDLWAGCNPNADSNSSDGPRALEINPDRGSTNAVVAAEHLHTPDRNNLLANGAGPDEIWLNPGDRRLYLASSNAANLGVIDVDSVEEVDSVTTATGSHSVAADSVRNLIYVPENAAGCPPNGCVAVFESGGGSTPGASH